MPHPARVPQIRDLRQRVQQPGRHGARRPRIVAAHHIQVASGHGKRG